MPSVVIKAHWMSGNWLGVFAAGKVRAVARAVINVAARARARVNVSARGRAKC